jgi:hypothetical protein
MRFAMEFFNPRSFGFQFYLAQYLVNNNKIVITKYQMPLGMNEYKKIDLYEMVNLKNKIK